MKKMSYPMLAAASTIFLAVLLRFMQVFELPVDAQILVGHVNELGLENSSLQLMSYVAFVGCVGALSLWLLLRPNGASFEQTRAQSVSVLVAMAFVVTLLLIGDKPPGFSVGFVVVYAGLFFWPRLPISAAFQSRPFAIGVLALLVFYGVAYLALPFFMQPNAESVARVVGSELHLAMTVLPGYELLCCDGAKVVERSNYGVSMLLASALSSYLGSLFASVDQHLVAGVKVMQFGALGLLLVAIGLLNKKNALLLFLAVLLLAPSLNTFGKAVSFPNQAGIRYLPFIMGCILLAYGIRVGDPKTIPFAIASAFLLFLSPETGLALFGGIAVFLILRKYRVDAPFKSVFLTAIPFGGIVLVLLALLSSIILPLLLKNSSPGIFAFMDLFASGYGGLVRKPSTFALLLVFFSLLALMRGILRARRGHLTSVDAYQAAVGVTILLWLPYYLNRMSEWNLWFHAILLLLLFAPRISAASFRLLRKRDTAGALQVRVALSLGAALVVSASVQTWSETWEYIETSSPECGVTVQPIAGYCFPGVDNPKLIAHVKHLDSLEVKSDFLVFSYFPAQVRLAGFNKGFPWYEPFGEVYREKEKREVSQWIIENGPRYLVVESPNNILSQQQPNRSAHFQSLVAELPTYGLSVHIAGWDVYERQSKQ